MAYYLSLDGVDDCVYYSTALTFDEIIIDCEVLSSRASFDKYIGTHASGFLQRNGSSQDQWSGNWSSVYVDGILKTNNTNFVPTSQRITIRATGTATLNNFFVIFANNSVGSGAMPGKLYGVTVKNAGTIVAQYDMTLGNVQDQSGNGRHATLTGGTWVSEGGTTHNGASSVQGVSTLSATATVIPAAITGTASLQGVATISATANVVSPSLTGSASLTGVGSVTATASVIRAGSASLQGVSTLTANAAGLNVLGGAFLTGIGWLMASAIEGTELVSVILLMGKRDLDIQLMGKRDLDVQLYASRELTVNLYGSR